MRVGAVRLELNITPESRNGLVKVPALQVGHTQHTPGAVSLRFHPGHKLERFNGFLGLSIVHQGKSEEVTGFEFVGIGRDNFA